jgi:hypothetical protein
LYGVEQRSTDVQHKAVLRGLVAVDVAEMKSPQHKRSYFASMSLTDLAG